MKELLVTKIPFGDVLAAAIRDLVHVVQEQPPHVIVVEGDSSAVQSVASLPEVISGSGIDGFKGNFNRSERLFVDAWSLQGKSTADTEHEGASWGKFGPQGAP